MTRNSDKKIIKHSISRQLGFVFILVSAGTILLCILLNSLFLEKYYMKTKQNIIYSAYEKIRNAANSDSYGTEEFTNELDEICRMDNITICIMDEKSQTKYVSVNGGNELEEQLIRYIFGIMPNVNKVLEIGEDYYLQQTGRTGNESLEMFGRLSTGISFIMSTPVESIRESAAIANRFFIYAGLFVTIIGAIIIWMISKRITRPIMELNSISEKMLHLDFDAKYEGKEKNEIGILGKNINLLSENLEKSISDLKTANNELKMDIEKKEQIDKIRKEFLSNVSHELKTPIALIQGYAEGLKEGINDNPESMNFYCDVIIDEASKMNVMVKKLLTLNQLEFGNDNVNMSRFDIVGLIRNYIQSSDIIAKQQGVNITFANTEEIYVWGDEFKVEEVLMNYISNAYNHCEFEKTIDIKVENIDGLARVTVFNTGKPIPEDAIEHIWEKFYKVDKARTREYGGSGIGLSIVKAIMEAMNQRYGVDNYNNGVAFWFELEIVKD